MIHYFTHGPRCLALSSRRSVVTPLCSSPQYLDFGPTARSQCHCLCEVNADVAPIRRVIFVVDAYFYHPRQAHSLRYRAPHGHPVEISRGAIRPLPGQPQRHTTCFRKTKLEESVPPNLCAKTECWTYHHAQIMDHGASLLGINDLLMCSRDV